MKSSRGAHRVCVRKSCCLKERRFLFFLIPSEFVRGYMKIRNENLDKIDVARGIVERSVVASSSTTNIMGIFSNRTRNDDVKRQQLHPILKLPSWQIHSQNRWSILAVFVSIRNKNNSNNNIIKRKTLFTAYHQYSFIVRVLIGLNFTTWWTKFGKCW